MKKRLFPLVIALLFGPFRAEAGDEPSDVVAVLSSNSGPYRDALRAFQKELGQEAVVVPLGADGRLVPPPGVRTVVAFGGKAARAAYPSDLNLIYCLSPGTAISSLRRRGATINISLTPQPDILAAQMKILQPGLRRLGILWRSPTYESELKSIEKAFAAAGVDVLAERLQNEHQLPEGLRRFLGRVDALWIPPDPVLINEKNLLSLKEFSWGNDIPFYAPTAGLVETGAVAAVSVTFAEIGRAAAGAARDLPSRTVPSILHVDRVEVVVNPAAAAACGLTFSPEAVKRATRVVSP